MVGGFLSGAAGGATVAIIVKAVDQFSNTFGKAQKGMNNFSKTGKAMTGALTTVAVAGAGAAVAVGKLALDAGEGVAIGNSFNNMFGEEAPKALDTLREATRGTVNDIDLMKQANQALLLGIDPEALPAMFEGALAASQATGRPVADAITDITTGIGRQSRLILDNLGIIVKSGEANDAYAKSLGKTTSELTDAEKKTAFMNATMEALIDNQEKVGEIHDTTAIKTQQLGAEFDNAKQKIGEAFGPAVQEILSRFSKFLTDLAPLFQERVMPALEMMFDALDELMGRFSDDDVDIFATALTSVLQGVIVFTSLIIKAFVALADLRNMFLDIANIVAQKVNASFNRMRIFLQTITKGFQLFGNTVQLAFNFVKLGAATLSNFLVDSIGGAINQLIKSINRFINSLPAFVRKRFDLSTIPTINLERFRVDTAAIESEIGRLGTEGQALSNEININIETLTGTDPNDIAEALRTKLGDLVSTN